MPEGKIWTKEEDEKALELYKNGHSGNSISNQLPGRSRNAVRGRLLRLQWGGASRIQRGPIELKGDPGRPYTAEEDLLIWQMRKEGKDIYTIASELGRSTGSLAKHAWKIGAKKTPKAKLYLPVVRKPSRISAGVSNRLVKVVEPMTKAQLYAMLQQAVLNTGGELV